MPVRMRTVPAAVAVIKELDPESAITVHFVRKLVKTGEIPHLDVGRKKLVNVDELLAYLEGGNIA